jgi:NADPH:quinone reductase-like Zn-dependent oxidoreductase
MVSMGILTFGDGTPQLGIEMSGVVTAIGTGVQNVQVGDRVIAVAMDGCFSTRAVMKTDLVVKIPDNLSFEDAATMPTVYGTVTQALMRVAQLERGKTVLIHSACGGIGHAAVQLCKNAGAEVCLSVNNSLAAV